MIMYGGVAGKISDDSSSTSNGYTLGTVRGTDAVGGFIREN